MKKNLILTVLAAMIVGSMATAPKDLRADVPEIRGPYGIGEWFYEFPDAFDIDPDDQDVDVRATVRYPAVSDGYLQPVADGGPFPFVAVLHGNHSPADPSYLGYNYFIGDLASWGFVVISIDGNDLNALPDRIAERARLILEHLRRWSEWSAPGGVIEGVVDMDRISLIGHSRGGEAVVAANHFNLTEHLGYGIKAVASIAPVDFHNYPMRENPYFVMFGSADGDVWDCQGFRIYDRALELPEPFTTHKGSLFIIGANHNFFNTEWTFDEGVGPDRISADDQRLIAKMYLMAFCLREIMPGRFGFLKPYFSGEAEFDLLAGLEMYKQYLDETHVNLDHFQDTPHDIATNSLGGPNDFGGLTSATEYDLRSLSPGNHQTYAGRLKWPDTGFRYFGMNLPFAGDASGFDYLSFRTAQVHSSPFNPAGQDQDFDVYLLDSQGVYAGVRVSDYGVIPYPYKGVTSRSVMNTIRIPMDVFEAGEVDLGSVSGIYFLFGATSTGEIVVDDVGVSN